MVHLIIEGGNRELAGKQFFLPNGIVRHLTKTLAAYEKAGGDKTIEGYDRLKNLLSNKYISYNELKRIKNFFDNYRGSTKSATFILNGGEIFKGWINAILDTATQTIKDKKQALKDAGFNNAFRKAHNKDRGLNGGKKTSMAQFDTKNIGKKMPDNQVIKYI